MKDDFDTYTKEMFGKNPVKPITDPDAKQFNKAFPVTKQEQTFSKEEGREAPKTPVKPKVGGGGAMPKSNRDITKNYKAGGKVSSASKRADGIAVKGKTRGRIV